MMDPRPGVSVNPEWLFSFRSVVPEFGIMRIYYCSIDTSLALSINERQIYRVP
jgi:hypothetical protein